MPVKVDRDREGGVEVPTMDEFNALVARVEKLETQLSKVINSGESVTLVSVPRSESITWITGNGKIESRDVPSPDSHWFIRRS